MQTYETLKHTTWECKLSTVGRDEVAVRRYTQEQENEDQRLEQIALMPL